VGIVEQELWSMKTITLGRSGLQVSRIAFGTWQLGRGLEKFAAGRGMTVSQVAIAWTLANPAVHVAIVGARRPQHVEESLAASDHSLTAADLAGIDAIMAAAVQVTGPSPESV
jgi:aryl-alcohol dehydrogenase-like predicted oxidoreductase